MSLKKEILWRVGVVYAFILIGGITILLRVFYLQFFEGTKWREKANTITLKNITVEPNRGDIRACDGRLLATSVPYYEVRVDMLSNGLDNQIVKEKIDSLAWCLSNLFKDKSPFEYKQSLLNARKNKNRYYLLKRQVTYDQMKRLSVFPIFRNGKYGGGLILIRTNRRIMPHGALAARTIGYLTKSNTGNVVGIEGSHDHYLKGVEGVRLMRRLSASIWMPVNNANEVEPQDGKDVITTIDINIQDVAQNALMRQLKKHDANNGTAILMEVETGEIRAIANLEKTKDSSYRETYNYAIGQSDEPGSTFKLPVLMVALEDGFIDLDDTINTGNGKVKFYNQVVVDHKEGGYGKLSVQEILEYSSNVGVAKIINQYYKGKEQRFVDRLYSMKLNEPTGIDIRGEGKPLIKYPGDKSWSGVTLPMMSFGYEIHMTPLQILSFYNAVANNGKMMRPMIIKEIQFHGQRIKRYEPEVVNPSICSYSTIKKAKQMLEGVVQNGTADNLKNNTYKIAGKTGTAKMIDPKTGSYINKYRASFVGYFPAENPKYSCIVVITNPNKGFYYGSNVAGPVFKEIADKVYATSTELQTLIADAGEEKPVDAPYSKNGYRADLQAALEYLKIPVESDGINNDWVLTSKKEKAVDYYGLNVMKYYVPNVKGMGLKDALFLLENSGLTVDVRGKGTVKEQSLAPGTVIKKGYRIELTMSM